MEIINNEQKSYNNLRLLDKLKPTKEKGSFTQWSQRELADIFVTFIQANIAVNKYHIVKKQFLFFCWSYN